MGRGVFAREDGVPSGLVTYEKDRNKKSGKNYLINRRAMVIHPLGISLEQSGKLTNENDVYAGNLDLAKPENWSLVADHKNVAITVLRHKISGLNASSFAIPRSAEPEIQAKAVK